jgi:hypothetical protein
LATTSSSPRPGVADTPIRLRVCALENDWANSSKVIWKTTVGHSHELKVDGLKVDGLKVDGLKVDGLKVDGLKVDGLKVDGLKVDGLNVDGANASLV